MSIKLYKGKIKDLGDSTADIAKNFFGKTYSYIEFEDGRMLNKLACFSGIDGKLVSELDTDGDVELHVFEGGKQPMLVALKSSSGRLYATEGLTESTPLIVKLLPISMGVLGVFLIPFFGIGFVLLFGAWKYWKGASMMSNIKKYVSDLPGAVYI
jgi:hypothetical protein